MATGKTPVSGGFAIFCGLFFVTIAIVGGLSWLTVMISLSLLVIAVMNWRGFQQKSNLVYQERMERLEQRLERDE